MKNQKKPKNPMKKPKKSKKNPKTKLFKPMMGLLAAGWWLVAGWLGWLPPHHRFEKLQLAHLLLKKSKLLMKGKFFAYQLIQ